MRILCKCYVWVHVVNGQNVSKTGKTMKICFGVSGGLDRCILYARDLLLKYDPIISGSEARKNVRDSCFSNNGLRMDHVTDSTAAMHEILGAWPQVLRIGLSVTPARSDASCRALLLRQQPKKGHAGCVPWKGCICDQPNSLSRCVSALVTISGVIHRHHTK